MPIYDYLCLSPECAHRFEARRRPGAHVTECPECGGALRQIFHPFVLKVRGKNWKPYSAESSVRGERYRSALIGEGELVR